jgi:hypothetical protein
VKLTEVYRFTERVMNKMAKRWAQDVTTEVK